MFSDTFSWRYGYYINVTTNSLLGIGGFVGLPSTITLEGSKFKRLLYDIGWIGAVCMSISLALFFFALE